MGRIWQRILGLQGEVMLVSLATHFTAVLLGISSATVLEGEAWPAAALRLEKPSMLLAIPPEKIDSSGINVGDNMQLVLSGPEPCAFQSRPMRLLAVEPVLLAAQSLEDFRVDEFRALVEGLSASGLRISQTKVKVPKCRDAGRMDVIIERHGE